MKELEKKGKGEKNRQRIENQKAGGNERRGNETKGNKGAEEAMDERK